MGNKEEKIHLGNPNTTGLTLTLGHNWEMEITKPGERYLVKIKNPEKETVHELDYPEKFWVKKRKRKSLYIKSF